MTSNETLLFSSVVLGRDPPEDSLDLLNDFLFHEKLVFLLVSFALSLFANSLSLLSFWNDGHVSVTNFSLS